MDSEYSHRDVGLDNPVLLRLVLENIFVPLIEQQTQTHANSQPKESGYAHAPTEVLRSLSRFIDFWRHFNQKLTGCHFAQALCSALQQCSIC